MNAPRFAFALVLAAIALPASGQAASPPAAAKPASSATAKTALAKAAPAAKMVLPFIEDDYERARNEARQRKIPIFIENWAPW